MPVNADEIFLLRLRKDGMFSNVNEVVEQLRLAQEGGYRFHIEWSRSCYRDPQRSQDPWDYYFEPCFPELPAPDSDLPILPGGVPIACSRANVITPRLEDGKCNPLLLPRDRNAGYDLIEAHLKLKPDVANIVERFIGDNFRDTMIGAHIRGPGRLDGGSGAMRRKLNPAGGVPYEVYFNAIDDALNAHSGAGLLVCSDSSEVIDRAQDRYGSRMVTYDAERSAFGEMHAGHDENEGQEFSTYKLGLDILVEAHLLARCKHFVHGNSNVANYVLCASPWMKHDYVPA